MSRPAPGKKAPKKRKHVDAFGTAKATPSSLLAKKARKNCRKVKLDEKFCEVTHDQQMLLDIDYPLDQCLIRRGVHEFVDEMRQNKSREKINIPIAQDFVMTIQNVVMTVELHRKKQFAEAPSYQSSRVAPPTKMEKAKSNLDMFVSPLVALKTAKNGHQPSIDDLLRNTEAFGNEVDDDDEEGDGSKTYSDMLAESDFYIPLNELTLYWRHYGAQHNNRRFTAVILRNYELNAASLVFSSGNIVCTGADRPELALWLLHSTLDKLRLAGFDNFETPHPQLRNIVSSGRFPNTLCTALLAVLYSNNCMRTDKFPGTMIFHEDMGKRVALVFDSGKICHSGAHSVEEIVHDMKVIWPILVRCQYTVQNQKDDEMCGAILGISQNLEGELVANTRTKIQQAYEQHKQDVQVKRIQSAQIRASNMRQKKQQQKGDDDILMDISV